MNLMTEISQKTLATYLDSKKWIKRYYPDFFPVKYSPFLSFESLIGSGRVSAADLVSYNSSAPQKTRRVISRLKGDIPALRTQRSKDEVDLNTYNIIKATAKTDQQMQALIDFVYDDVAFVVESVNSKLEYIALQALSQTALSLNATNNGAGVVTEKSITFGMAAGNKEKEAAAANYWTVAAKATNTPIDDITAIQKEARKAGVKIQYMVMNSSKYVEFRSSAQVLDFCYGILISQAGIVPNVSPTLETINKVMKESSLPQIILIDTFIDLENEDHDITAVDPWENAAGSAKYVLFCPELPLGNMICGPIAAENIVDPSIVQSKIGQILVQSISSQDPVNIKTVGLTNAFVDWNKIDQCWSLNTEATSW